MLEEKCKHGVSHESLPGVFAVTVDEVPDDREVEPLGEALSLLVPVGVKDHDQCRHQSVECFVGMVPKLHSTVGLDEFLHVGLLALVTFLALPPFVERLELVLVIGGEQAETVSLDAEVVPSSFLGLFRFGDGWRRNRGDGCREHRQLGHLHFCVTFFLRRFHHFWWCLGS